MARPASVRGGPSGPRSWTCSGIVPAAWVEQLRHGSKAPNAGFHAVEQPLGDLRAADVVFGDLGDRPVHRQVVLAGGDEQVRLLDPPVLVHPVMVEEDAARRLAAADPLALVDA